MTKKSGKVYDKVEALLKKKGFDPAGLEIATLGRGTDHLVILDGETIGEYNHRSGRLLLYSEAEWGSY